MFYFADAANACADKLNWPEALVVTAAIVMGGLWFITIFRD